MTDDFLLLDQTVSAEEEPARRPWSRCRGCGRRIWANKSLLHRKGDKCRRGQRQHRRGGRLRVQVPRTHREVTGQADLFTTMEESEQPSDKTPDPA
ncbi:hypothetical protein GCM10010404_80850 [Nonomuraea africana]|uniref:Uncharacterized protein n=1 Tax=Nonomuraea africana TaxID=46171 RepID=A0ABR9KWY6_9ACTN|nr:hypothetical protein [Nonomuraea africana]MBE1566537.1 hypothetical protein [Nonomuraea africana]